jgi:AcrR family transcriptional regulator
MCPQISSVQEGVFFTPPDVLPRGRHKLPREQVRAAQRERMLAAVTELLAAHGYRGFGPADIARRAGVSLEAFYDLFENKDACVFAGYDRFIGVLLERMRSIDPPDHATDPELVRAPLDAYLETLQSDLVVARAYQVEIDALGPPARRRRRDSLRLFADYIRQITIDNLDGEEPDELNASAYVGVVYATRQLASDALDSAEEPDLIGLGEELGVWLTDLFRPR